MLFKLIILLDVIQTLLLAQGGEKMTRFHSLDLSSPSLYYSQRGCGNYGCRYSGSRNSRNIFAAAGNSLCLCGLERSGW